MGGTVASILQGIGMSAEQAAQITGYIAPTAGTAMEAAGPAAAQAGQVAKTAAPMATAGKAAQAAGGVPTGAPQQPMQLSSGGTQKRKNFGQSIGDLLNPIKNSNPGNALTLPMRVGGGAYGDAIMKPLAEASGKTEARTTAAIRAGGRSTVAQPNMTSAATGQPVASNPSLVPDANRAFVGMQSDAQMAARPSSVGATGSYVDASGNLQFPTDAETNSMARDLMKSTMDNMETPKERLGRDLLEQGLSRVGQRSGPAGGPIQPTPDPNQQQQGASGPSIIELIMQLMGGGDPSTQPPNGPASGGIRG